MPLQILRVMDKGKETWYSCSGRVFFLTSLSEIRDSGLDSRTPNSNSSGTVQSRRQRGYADGLSRHLGRQTAMFCSSWRFLKALLNASNQLE